MKNLHRVHVNIWLVLGLILVIFTWGWWSFQQDLVDPAVKVANVPINIVKKVASVVSKPKSVAVSASYTQALIDYKDARIQLDSECRAIPSNVTYKNGTSIMIDNRAPVARTVTAGSTFSIPAYGFKIVNLSSATLPATWYVNCDQRVKVATILIQK